MGFPVVQQVLDSHTEPNNSSHAVSINFTTRTVGDLMVVITSYDGENAMTWPAGWTAITNAAGLDGSSDQRTEARYRQYQAGDPTSITITSTSDVWTSFAIRITGHESGTAPECAAATGSSGNVNPPSVTPSWGAADTLWLAYANVASGDASVSAAPTNYTSHGGDNAGSGTGGVAHGLASRSLNATSQDPGTFTNTSGAWRGLTVAVKPGTAGVEMSPPSGGLTLTGVATSLALSVAVGSGALAVTGAAPSLHLVVPVPTGALTLTGHAPTVAQQTGSIVVPTGALTLDGQAPGLDLGVSLPPAALDLTGHIPTVQVSRTIEVGVGELALAGTTPSLELRQPVPTAALAITGHAPTALSGVGIQTGLLVLTGHAPTLAIQYAVDTAALVVDGPPPTLQITTPPWVQPEAIRIEVALAPSYQAAVLADSPVGFWRLSDAVGPVALDTATSPHHGTYVGDPSLFVPSGLLDGNRGVGFNGDPDAVTMGDVAACEFSGACSVECWIRRLGNPGSEQWLVSKYTAASTVGWYVSLTTGGLIRCVMRNAAGSADAFNVTSAVVTDGAWHHIVWTWTGTTAANGVKIYVDTALSGQGTASTASVSTSNADFLLATRNDSTAYFDGALDDVAVYASTVSATRVTAHYTAATVWTDLSTDVIQHHGITLDYGMGGQIYDRIARVGRLDFVLRNDAGNTGQTVGWYSPHHPQVRSGWDYNIPTRLAITYAGITYYWRGTLDTVDPVPGRTRDRIVRCQAVDWMDDAQRALANIPIQVQKRGDEIFQALLAKTSTTPVLTDLQAGLDTYPYGGDNILATTKVIDVLHSVAMSGLDYIGQRRDTVGGQTVFFENRSSRLFDTSVLITLDETMHELTLDSRRSKVTNCVLTTVYPRRVDSVATTVIATLFEGVTQPVTAIAPGQTVLYWLDYTDPFQRSTKIGGTDQVTPVSGTDYQMFQNADGTGSDRTANFTVTPDFFASGVKLTVRNTSGSLSAFITKLQVRGKGIYAFNPVQAESRDEDSILTYDEQYAHITMPFQADPNVGFAAAGYLMNLYSNPLSATRSVRFYANAGHDLMVAALDGDISDRIALSESISGINGLSFHIHGVRFEIAARDRIAVTWHLAPSDASAGSLWILQDPASELDVNTVLGAL